MADLDTLNGLLSDIATDATEVASQHSDLVNQLQALQQQIANNQPVDLTGAIATARTIKTTLDGIAQAASSGTSTTDAGTGSTDTGATDTAASDGSTATDDSAPSAA